MKMAHQVGPVVLSVLLGALSGVTGCTSGGTASTHTPSPAPTHTSAAVLTRTAGAPSVQPADPVAAYVRTVDTLCSSTKADVVKIVASGYSAGTPVKVFLAQAPRLRSIYRSFDVRLAKVVVPVAGGAVATAMHDYVSVSDVAKKQMIAAATRGQRAYATEYNRQLVYWSSGAGGAVVAKRDAAGLSEDCNYR